MAGGCQGGKGLAPPLLLFPFMDWRQETLGFLAPRVWRMAGERGIREREIWEKELSIFLASTNLYIVHVYINTGSSDPNPKLP